MYDCREPLIRAVRVLSTLETSDFRAKSEDRLDRCASTAIKNFYHHYSVWRFNFDELLDAIDRRQLDKLADIAFSMTIEHSPNNWKSETVKSSLKWRRIRSAATQILEDVKDLASPEIEPSFPGEVAVATFDSDYIKNPPSPDELAETEYGATKHDCSWAGLREDLVFICAKHGHVGPDDPIPSPQFYVPDDQYNNERYHYLQVFDPDCVTLAWLADLMNAVQEYDGWGICIPSLTQGMMVVFDDRIMLRGERLRRCRTPADVVAAVKELIQE
ncbi:MAG: hypothetical protein RIC55_07425 [Pirellulaceae bacterium]